MRLSSGARAGATWVTATGTRRAIAGALPVAVLFAEAAHRFVQIAPWEGFDLSGTYAQVMLAEAIAGGVLAWLVIRSLDADRRTGYVAAAGLTAAGLAAFVAVENLARVLAFL